MNSEFILESHNHLIYSGANHGTTLKKGVQENDEENIYEKRDCLHD
jgi:hypothetical protein